eukprot:1621004-Lingulodinium_polyedra.AAC.1
MIENNSAWEWVSSVDKCLLLKLKQNLDAFSMKSKFWQNWNLLEPGELKRQTDSETAAKEMESLPSLFENISNLEKN